MYVIQTNIIELTFDIHNKIMVWYANHLISKKLFSQLSWKYFLKMSSIIKPWNGLVNRNVFVLRNLFVTLRWKKKCNFYRLYIFFSVTEGHHNIRFTIRNILPQQINCEWNASQRSRKRDRKWAKSQHWISKRETKTEKIHFQ